MSRKGGTGVGEMGVSALDCTKALVGTGRILFGINGFRNKLSHLVGPPLTPFNSIISLAFPRT